VARAEDIGILKPGLLLTGLQDPREGRNLIDYTARLGTGTTIEIEETKEKVALAVDLYLLKAIADDFYLAVRFDGANEIGGSVLVARPPTHRKTDFDGKTFTNTSGIELTYDYLSLTERIVTSEREILHQFLEPPFHIDEDSVFTDLLIVGKTKTGIDGVSLIDLNVDGRRWVSTPELVMSIVGVQDDYLVCRTIAADGTLGIDDVLILKPFTLRRTPFDGLTVDGVSYVYVSNTERIADLTDTYLITPNYYVGAEILVTKQNNFVAIETGDSINLVDGNSDSRTWALEI